MTQRETGSIWSHLPSAFGPRRAQTKQSLAEAMWPGLSPPSGGHPSKPQSNSDRDALLRHLRETNSKAKSR
jgi:hypothetical protein